MALENSEPIGADWLALLSALSDHARVRLLRLLEDQELGVGELARALSMPQSTVSRHLKLLYELGLLNKRSEGTASLYRMRISDAGLRSLWSNTTDRLGREGEFRDDEIRLRQVLLERRSDALLQVLLR